MTDNCRCDQPDIMILSCSGGNNTGRIANRAAWELTGEGLGRMFCLAGIGANISGFVQSAKEVTQMVVIDGCETACAGILLQDTGVAATSGPGDSAGSNSSGFGPVCSLVYTGSTFMP